MTRLFFLIYTLAGSALAGIGVIAVLAMNYYDVKSIVISALVGAVVGIPVSWGIAKQLENI